MIPITTLGFGLIKNIPFLFKIFPFLFKIFSFLKEHIIVLFGVLFLVLAVFGFFWYQKSLIDDLNSKLTAVSNENKKLEQDNISLRNLSIFHENMLKLKDEQLKNREKQIEELVKIYKRVEREKQIQNKKLKAIEREILNKEKNEKKERIRNSNKNSLLLRKENNNIKCFIDNFSKDGVCKNGKFYENTQ